MHPIEVEAGVMLASRYLLERLIEQVPSGAPSPPPPPAGADLTDQEPAPSVAQTWYSKDSVLSRPVIVHTLPVKDPRAPRLIEAARQAATANDVHFLRILDADSDGEVAYIVREWVAGRTLTELLADGPLPAEPAGWIVREVAQAVTSLHAQGTAHLRLDPDNVILTEAGAVRIKGLITDAVLHDETPADEKTATRRDTRDLGRLLYAALTARWPGDHAQLRAAPRSTDGSPLSPRQCRAGVPRVLDEITDRILADRPRHGSPLVSPLEVTAALSDAVGDAPPDGIQPTAPVRNGTANSQPSPDDEATALYRRPVAPAAAAAGAAVGSAPPAAAAAMNGRPDPEAGGGIPLAGGIGTGATVTYAERRPDPPKWRTAVATIVAIIFLGGIALIGWQLAFQGGERPGVSEEPSDQSEDDPEEPPASADEPAATKEAKGPYKVSGTDDFDPPPGNNEERPEEVGNVADGDPGTMWTTVEYYNYPELGRLKDGVGVWVDLGAERKVGSVDVSLRPGGTNLELRAATGADEPPTDIDDWQTVGTADDADADVTFTPDEPVTTRYLLLWLTKLPPSEGGFRGGISEVVVNR